MKNNRLYQCIKFENKEGIIFAGKIVAILKLNEPVDAASTPSEIKE